MYPELLFEISCYRTGTRFLSRFMGLLEGVGAPFAFTVKDHFSPTKKSIGLYTHCDPAKAYRFLFDRLEETWVRDYLQAFPEALKSDRYWLFNGHVTNPQFMWYLIALQPFEFKVIAPIRHPYTTLISNIKESSFNWGQKVGDRIDYVSMYLLFIMALKSHGNFQLLPVDLLGALSPEDRIVQLEHFVKGLDLEMNEEALEYSRVWQPVSSHKDQDYDKIKIPDQMEREIRGHIEESRVLDFLKDVGVSYTEEPPTPWKKMPRKS